MSRTTERGQARKHPNSETSPARESAGSLRTPRKKSTVDTAAALDTVLGFFQTLVRKLFREETIEVIETKGAMVSSENDLE